MSFRSSWLHCISCIELNRKGQKPSCQVGFVRVGCSIPTATLSLSVLPITINYLSPASVTEVGPVCVLKGSIAASLHSSSKTPPVMSVSCRELISFCLSLQQVLCTLILPPSPLPDSDSDSDVLLVLQSREGDLRSSALPLSFCMTIGKILVGPKFSICENTSAKSYPRLLDGDTVLPSEKQTRPAGPEFPLEDCAHSLPQPPTCRSPCSLLLQGYHLQFCNLFFSPN